MAKSLENLNNRKDMTKNVLSFQPSTTNKTNKKNSYNSSRPEGYSNKTMGVYKAKPIHLNKNSHIVPNPKSGTFEFDSRFHPLNEIDPNRLKSVTSSDDPAYTGKSNRIIGSSNSSAKFRQTLELNGGSSRTLSIAPANKYL